MSPPSFTASPSDDPLAPEADAVAAFKKVTVLTLGAAMERFGTGLQDQQEVLLWIADLVIDTYGSESAFARATVAQAFDPSTVQFHHAAARTFISDAALRVETTARQILAALAEGDMLRQRADARNREVFFQFVNIAIAVEVDEINDLVRHDGIPLELSSA